MTQATVYELKALYDSRASFYGKAQVIIEQEKGCTVETLQSYNTQVARIFIKDQFIVAEVYGTYSATTLRHIKDFLLQNGFKAESKQQIINDYGTVKK